MRHQRRAFLLALLGVCYVDQLTKAWAWRHLTRVHINSGGDMLVGAGIGAWFRDPVRGAVFDVLDALLLASTAVLLARRSRPRASFTFASLLIAGWAANLLDRLGMHYVTAPGSVRGVVDWIPWQGRFWNLADLVIIASSLGLTVSLLHEAARRLSGRSAARGEPRSVAVHRHRRSRLRSCLAAGAGVATTCVLAAIGAISYAGVSGPVELLASR